MKKTAFLLLVLFISSFFAVACEPKFEETAVIQILDGMLRPIENASVQITYQVDQTTGKGYAITSPKLTNSDGMTTIIFQNKEILKERVDCMYTITAIYDNKKAEMKVNVDSHPSVIQLKLDVYRLNIKAVDQFGNVLSGAVISVRDINRTTSKDGQVTILIGSGTSNVTLKYGQGIVSRSIMVSTDTDYNYQVGVYDLNLNIIDDQNAPLVADVSIGEKTLRTDSNGFLTLKKLLTAKPEIKTVYKGIERKLNTDLAVQRDYYIVYDLHAPKISDLKARYENGGVLLNITVTDSGVRASGLAPDGIKMKYSFGGSDYVAPVYVKSKNKYEAIFTNIDRSGIVEVLIEAKDNEGNVRSVRGYFSVEFVNDTISENNTESETTDEGTSLQPVHILALGGVIIVLLFAIKYIREKMMEQ